MAKGSAKSAVDGDNCPRMPETMPIQAVSAEIFTDKYPHK